MMRKLLQMEYKKFVPQASHNIYRLSSTEHVKHINDLFKAYKSDSWTNVTDKIYLLTERKLMQKIDHPIYHMGNIIKHYFKNAFIFKPQIPIVSVKENFDNLLVPVHHPSRRKSDCYYLNQSIMLRSHCTAHYSKIGQVDNEIRLILGDCYRRDSIDRHHYPCFHQCDVVYIPKHNDDIQSFKDILESFIRFLFKLKSITPEIRWVDAYFPFTDPSFELEIKCKKTNKWLEVLGCGKLRNELCESLFNVDNKSSIFASGIGIDRLAMLFYDITDIRVLWSHDEGILHQFRNLASSLSHVSFRNISSYPPCIMDISFWIDGNKGEAWNRHEVLHNFYEIVRDVAGDIVEHVDLKDVYALDSDISYCFRIYYRSMVRNLTKSEVKQFHEKIEKELELKLNFKIR